MHATEMLEKEAKKYKNFFEKVNIYPLAYQFNGDRFYYVAYVKGNSQLKGQAIISTQKSINQKEFEQVFWNLTLMKQLTHSIDTDGKVRANIDMTPFNKVKTFLKDCLDSNRMTEDKNATLKRVLHAFELNIEMQDELVKTFENYDKHIQSIIHDFGHFTEEDLSDTLHVLAVIDYLQYKQLYVLWEVSEDVDEVLRIIPDDEMGNQVRNFLKEFTVSKKAKLEKDLDKVVFQKEQHELSREDYVERVKEIFKDNVHNVNKENVSIIRNKGIDTSFITQEN
ncbi:hypothetical protein [Pontibacillus salipaludis]|uniref:hypothetical protein n=1 Tax=Pontibacillus salipaludis TaxID=1697394 RepID=UPI0031EEAC01